MSAIAMIERCMLRQPESIFVPDCLVDTLPHPEHEPVEEGALYAPNLVLWNGRSHVLALMVKIEEYQS